MRPRGLIWTISKRKLQSLYDSSNTLTEVLEKIGVYTKGANRTKLKKRQIASQISLKKLNHNRKIYRNEILKSRDYNDQLQTIDKLKAQLILSNKYDTGYLKKHLINFKLLKNECAICKLQPIWNNRPLKLQLDHINGISCDNRIENLRIVCPNCHTQTDTFSGRNKRSQELAKVGGVE